jgi:hypothetical protein
VNRVLYRRVIGRKQKVNQRRGREDVCVCVCVSEYQTISPSTTTLTHTYTLSSSPTHSHTHTCTHLPVHRPLTETPTCLLTQYHLHSGTPPRLAPAKLTPVPVLSLQIPAYHRAPYLPYPILLYPPYRSALLPAPPRPNRRPCKLPPSVLRHPTHSCTRASGTSSSPTLHEVRSADCGPGTLTVDRGCAQGCRLARLR